MLHYHTFVKISRLEFQTFSVYLVFRRYDCMNMITESFSEVVIDLLTLKLAEKSDFDRIIVFFKYVIDNTETMPAHCRWVFGLHPTSAKIKRYVDEGTMYLHEEDGEIISAVAMLPYQEEDYHGTVWAEDLPDNEVAALHLLCVNPKYQRRGIAGETLAAVYEIAKAMGKKSVRLDTLGSNISAQMMYEKLGYTKVDVKKWWYLPNNYLTDFVLYEKIICN